MSSPTVGRLAVEHLAYCRRLEKRGRIKARTVRELEGLYRRAILPELEGVELCRLTEARVERWHSKIGREAPVQANRAVAALRAGWRVAQRAGLVSSPAPLAGFRDWRNPEVARARVLTPQELEAVVSRLNTEIRTGGRGRRLEAVALKLLILTGARHREILGLRWSEVEPDRKSIRLTDSKTGAKTIWLSTRAGSLLRFLELDRRGDPRVFEGRTARRLWDRVRRDTGNTDITIHDLRRSFCSRLADAGVPLEDVAALVGSKSLAIQRDVYRHLSPSRKVELANIAAH